jgi:leucyl-tRNA---protein transferase
MHAGVHYDSPMTAPSIRLYQTQDHACGYWPERTARDLLLDPREPSLPLLYGQMLALGFRRSGGNVYRPRCAGCNACTPLRLPVTQFVANRSQRRCVARNADLHWQDVPAEYNDERFALYRHYLGSRHAGGGMDQASRFDFEQFLKSDWSPTRFLEARLDGRLVAVAVTDVVDDALSAVYTFFDPGLADRSLGTCAVLQQIDCAKARGRQYLYLGFWLAGHPKMHYKAGFRPAQVLRDGRWQAFATEPSSA